ncbi:MAG: hybrid sensor histidine kinase/response regulator [Pseudomonadales bacterium]|nr:hybrid sensor histidine kinase/response regulator [Pseudomonadales bacterium]
MGRFYAWLVQLYEENFKIIPPSAQIAKRVRAAQLDIAIQESRLHFVGAIVSVSFCFWVFFDASEPYLAFIWWGCAIPLLLINYIMQWQIFRRHKDKLTLVQWEWIVFFMYAGWGALWALAPWLFLPGVENPYTIMIMLLTLIAICVTVIIAASAYPASYLVLAIPILLSTHLFFMRLDWGTLNPRQSTTMMGLIPFFGVFLTIYMLKLRKTMHTNTVLHLENEQANINKSQFLAAASHDIRQPLQASRFYWEALSAEHSESEMLKKLGSCLNNLSDLLDNLLDVSRLDAQTISNNPEHIKVDKLLSSVVESFAPLASDKGIELSCSTTDLCLYVDPILLERVLLNLVSNALNNTKQGLVTIDCELKRNDIELIVTDTGIGIPREEQDAIFDEFYQLDNPERDRHKGLGLGLAIVKRLCALMQCPLRLESRIGIGTRFSLTLPQGKIACIQADPTNSQRVEQGMSVLLIDDEALIRDSLQSMFERWKMECLTFESADTAISFLSRHKDWMPDCIISDYRLKENKTGNEAIRDVTRLLGKEIPAIVLTGDTHPQRINEAHQSGYTVVHKPVKPAFLRTAITLVTS